MPFVAFIGGIGNICNLDSVLLWLWFGFSGVALFHTLAQELAYATGTYFLPFMWKEIELRVVKPLA